MNVSQFLINRLNQIGVDTVFGIPGDYILPFFDDLVSENSPVKHWGTTNELTAANLADGYARERGLGCVAVTYGPGAFNTINGIGGAYSENVPLLLVSGCPNVDIMHEGKLLHHLIGGDVDVSMRVFKEITAAVDRIVDPATAVAQIDKLIEIALTQKKPVYLEIPYNIQISECPNIVPWTYTGPKSNPDALKEATNEIVQAIKNCNPPAALTGVFIERNKMQQAVEDLLKNTAMPFATSFDSKCGFLEHLENCAGFYQGKMSESAVISSIEGSDCLVSIGMPMTEFNTGMFTNSTDPSSLIYIGNDHVNVFGKIISDVYFCDIIPLLVEELPASITSSEVAPLADTFEFTRTKPLNIEHEKAMTVDKLFQRMAHYIEDGDIVTGDTGGYINSTRMRMRKGNTTSGPGNWGSLGAGFPISAGIKIASPQRRAICLDGDGSFQMTGQELATLVKHRVDYLLIILNNEGYTAERAIQPEKTEAGLDSYNDIQPWQYQDLAQTFGAPKSMHGAEVFTEGDFEEALSRFKPGCGPLVVNVHLDKLDVASFNSKMSEAMKH